MSLTPLIISVKQVHISKRLTNVDQIFPMKTILKAWYGKKVGFSTSLRQIRPSCGHCRTSPHYDSADTTQSTAGTMTVYCRGDDGVPQGWWRSSAGTMTEYRRDDDGVLQGQWWSTTGTMTEKCRDNEGVPQGQWWSSQGRWQSTAGAMMKYHRDGDGVVQGRCLSTAGMMLEYRRDDDRVSSIAVSQRLWGSSARTMMEYPRDNNGVLQGWWHCLSKLIGTKVSICCN